MDDQSTKKMLTDVDCSDRESHLVEAVYVYITSSDGVFLNLIFNTSIDLGRLIGYIYCIFICFIIFVDLNKNMKKSDYG